MNRLALNFWDSIEQILQGIGRGATWPLKKRHSTAEECSADATTGGALTGAVLGGVAGFVLSDFSRNVNALEGTIFCALLGACIGIMFAAIVETVDSELKDLLKSLDSK